MWHVRSSVLGCNTVGHRNDCVLEALPLDLCNAHPDNVRSEGYVSAGSHSRVPDLPGDVPLLHWAATFF